MQSHQVPAKAGSKQLPPKTPGPRYPKTPIKIPLNDENAPVTGGKGLLGGGKNTATRKQALATPMGKCDAAGAMREASEREVRLTVCLERYAPTGSSRQQDDQRQGTSGARYWRREGQG